MSPCLQSSLEKDKNLNSSKSTLCQGLMTEMKMDLLPPTDRNKSQQIASEKHSFNSPDRNTLHYYSTVKQNSNELVFVRNSFKSYTCK